MKIIIIKYLLITCLFISSCKDNPGIFNYESTTVSGFITDAITGKPISNAEVSLFGETQSYPYQTISDYYVTKTDGYYSLNVTGEYLTITHMFAEAINYAKFGDLVKKGHNNIRNIKLHAFDSYIKFNISNSKMVSDTFWGYFDNPILLDSENPILKFGLNIIPQGTTVTEVKSLPGNTNIYIRWGYDKNTIYKDSVYMKSGETLEYNIIM